MTFLRLVVVLIVLKWRRKQETAIFLGKLRRNSKRENKNKMYHLNQSACCFKMITNPTSLSRISKQITYIANCSYLLTSCPLFNFSLTSAFQIFLTFISRLKYIHDVKIESVADEINFFSARDTSAWQLKSRSIEVTDPVKNARKRQRRYFIILANGQNVEFRTDARVINFAAALLTA